MQGGKFRSLPLPGGKQLKRIASITLDADGAVWMADLDRGVFRWHGHDLTEITGTGARILYADRSGRVWMGLRDGSLVVCEDDHLRVLSSKDGLADTSVSSFYEDKNGKLWIGFSKTISYVDGNQVRSLSQDRGLPIANVVGIVEDASGDMWIAGSSGIVRVSRPDLERAIVSPSLTLQYTLYDTSDGLRGVPTRFGSSSAVRSPDGNLWFVTGTGLVRLDPLVLAKNHPAPKVWLQDVLVNGTSLHSRFDLNLPAGTSRLDISYTAPTLTNSSKVSFRYQLDGFDSDWIDAGKRRQAFYTNLPPGRYQFRVAAVTGGLSSEADTVLVFSIAPFAYQTPWFKGACVLLFAVSLIAAWRLRLRYVRRGFSLVLSERGRMAREIHDTLLQGLVGLSLGLDELLSEVKSTPKRAGRHIEDLRDQVETYVRETRQSIWDLQSPVLEQHDLAEALRRRARSVIGSQALQLDCIISGTPRRCSPKVEEQILRVGQEAVSNAVRHARAEHVRIELCYQDDAVLLRVADDGKGFDPDRPMDDDRAHCGLAGMRERVNQVRGHFTLSSAPGHGTRVEALVPLQ